jgi:uncharacterized protein YecA (UPF0149 family)
MEETKKNEIRNEVLKVKNFFPSRIKDKDGSVYSLNYKRTEKKIGRNEPCPCNSGKKYKKCCGFIEVENGKEKGK